MRQKRRRSSGENLNRNERSISNSREVSRRNKGKSRYAYEEEYYNSKKKDEFAYPSKRSTDVSYAKKSSAKNTKKKTKRRGRRKNFVSKTIGMILAILQFVLSAIFVVNVLFFGMLPTTYVMVLVGVLMILLGITLLTQIGSRGKGIPGKIFCILMCIVLGTGSFYMGEVNSAMQDVLGGDTKTSAIVVAVLKDDKAEEIKDAADYTFGVHYSADESQIRATISEVEEKIGEEIEIKEYDSIIEEAQALFDGEVQAIIYKASQTSVVSEQIEDFEDSVKVIYTHNIVVEIENEAVDASMTEPFAVYLSGIDVYGDITQESRSDVNIVAVVNPTSHQVLLITTPRDYHVPIPGISNGQRDKLTHAGIYGVDASMAALEGLYDVEIPFYGRVNFTSMINIVDALGGLDVYSDAEFTTSKDSEHIMHVEEGMNHFNGKEALAFCRERKNLPDGDNARGRHQQAVITAIIQKMMSPAMLRGAMDILDTVSDGVDTNFTTEQLQSLIKTQLRTGAEWYIYSVSAEGTGAKKTCYSSGSAELYVTVPSETSVANIEEMIDAVEAGELIEGSVGTSGTVVEASSNQSETDTTE